MRTPTMTLHHYAPHTVKTPIPLVASPPGRRGLRWCAVQLARRPILGLTLALVLVLLVSSISEVAASWQITTAIHQMAAGNVELRQLNDQTTQMIATRSAPAAIIHAAQLLGWVVPPGSVLP